MSPLAVIVLSAALLGSTGAAAVTPPSILFAADNLPAVAGEVYRLDADGHLVDLSKSPFRDLMPMTAPSGKSVAFVSNRGGTNRIYLVGIDGTRLRRLESPPLDTPAQLVWAPNSKALAVVSFVAKERLTIVGPDRKSKVIARGDVVYNPEWSPDSRLLTVTVGGIQSRRIDAFTPAGRLVWHVPFQADAGWSTRGLFAAYGHTGVTVYDEAGRVRFHFQGRIAAWSPDGRRLASVVRGRLEVRTGEGRLFLSKTIRGLDGRRVTLAWADSRRVLVNLFPRVPESTPPPARSLPARSATSTSRVQAACSRTRRKAAPASQFASHPSAAAAPTSTATCRAASTTASSSPALDSLQFVPGRRSLVYTSNCAEPFSALYAVAARRHGPDAADPRERTAGRAGLVARRHADRLHAFRPHRPELQGLPGLAGRRRRRRHACAHPDDALRR